MIERIVKIYGNKTGSELSEITHKEAPWNAVDDFAVIDYELAYYRETNFGE